MTGLAPPSPYQASPGNFLTASLWNAQIFNGLTFLLNPPMTMLYASASQSIPTSAGTTIALDTAVTDPYGAFSSGAHTWTAPFSAWWEIRGHVNWAANSTGNRATWFNINSTTATTSETWGSVGATTLSLPSDCIAYVTQGQTISLIGWQSSGAALATTTASGTFGALSIKFAHL